MPLRRDHLLICDRVFKKKKQENKKTEKMSRVSVNLFSRDGFALKVIFE